MLKFCTELTSLFSLCHQAFQRPKYIWPFVWCLTLYKDSWALFSVLFSLVHLLLKPLNLSNSYHLQMRFKNSKFINSKVSISCSALTYTETKCTYLSIWKTLINSVFEYVAMKVCAIMYLLLPEKRPSKAEMGQSSQHLPL